MLLFAAPAFPYATPMVGEVGAYPGIRGGAAGILSNDLQQMITQMDELTKRIETANPQLAPELNKILGESKSKIEAGREAARVARVKDEKRGRAQIMNVRLMFLDFARRIGRLFKKGDPVLEEIRRASGLSSFTGDALEEAELALALRSFLDGLKTMPGSFEELYRLHGAALMTELPSIGSEAKLREVLDSLAKRYGSVSDFLEAHDKIAAGEAGKKGDSSGADEWMPDLMDVDDRVRLADADEVPAAPPVGGGSAPSAPTDSSNVDPATPAEQSDSAPAAPARADARLPALPQLAPVAAVPSVLVKTRDHDGKIISRGSGSSSNTSSHGGPVLNPGLPNPPAVDLPSAPARGNGGAPLPGNGKSFEDQYNDSLANGTRAATPAQDIGGRGSLQNIPITMADGVSDLFNTLDQARVFGRTLNMSIPDPLAFASRNREHREKLGLDETCGTDAKGLECQCRAKFDSDPTLGGESDLNKLWRKIAERDEGDRSLACQDRKPAHKIQMALQKTGEKSSAYAYRLQLAQILRSQCIDKNGKMDLACLMKPNGFFDNHTKLRSLKFLSNRGLPYHLALGQVPPSCALYDPYGTWTTNSKMKGADGLDDACRKLDIRVGKNDASFSNSDRMQIYNAVLFSRSLAQASSGDEPEDCGPAKAERLGGTQSKDASTALRKKSFMVMDLIENQKSISLRDGREIASKSLLLGKNAGDEVARASEYFTSSGMNGLFNNLLRCSEPGQLGWAYREAEKQLRKMAIACGSQEATNFEESFGSPSKMADFLGNYREIANGFLDPDHFVQEDLDKVMVGKDCDELRIRGSGKSSRLVFKLRKEAGSVGLLHPKDMCADSDKYGPAGIRRSLRKLYENDIFMRMTKGIRDGKVDRSLKKEGVDLHFTEGALAGATFGSCSELVETHRVMMYMLLSPSAIGRIVLTEASGVILAPGRTHSQE